VYAVIQTIWGTWLYLNASPSNKGTLVDFFTLIGYIAFVCLAFGTSVHLWSLVPTMPEGTPIRNLFRLMGVSFVIISIIFLYSVINSLQIYAGVPTLTSLIDSSPDLSLRSVIFYVFNIQQRWAEIEMPLDSIVTFAFIMVGVSVLIYPLEKYVKGRKPWFSISMWIALLLIIVIIPFRENVSANINVTVLNTWVLSVATLGIVLFVIINFIYMFYLYISLAVMSAGKMRTASTLVAFGLIMMIMVWILNMISSDYRVYIEFATGLTAMIFFNLGFKIMRG
jgi:hypothetical protein